MLDDWRDVPKESTPALIIVDEAQYHTEFMKETTKDNQKGKDLSTHRHKGVDFWLITQSPKLLNPYVIENVGEHVHLYRPRKKKTVTVYWWSYAVTNLTKSNFQMADDVQKWRLNPNMFDLYKSTVNVTDGQSRTSQKTISTIITFVIIICGIGFMVNQGMNSFNEMQHKNDETVLAVDKKQLPAPQQQEKKEEPKQEDKQEEKEDKIEEIQTVSTSPPIPPEPEPYIVGCLSNDTTCKCYNDQGGLVKMDYKTCKAYFAGEKPYQVRTPSYRIVGAEQSPNGI